MKKSVQSLLLLLIATVLFLGCFFVQADASTTQFSDVKQGEWFYEAVTQAVKSGLMNGVGVGTFSPNTSADRAMLVTLLYRMEGEPAVEQNAPFTDLEAEWYRKSVAWAYANGIVNGLTDTTFGPAQKLTREQFATILYRYCKDYLKLEVGSAASLSEYPDQNNVSGYAKAAMAWANAEKLITGTARNGKVYLDPQGDATRAQMATIFQRFDGYREQMMQQEPPVDEPIAKPVEKPCRFGGEAYHSHGTIGMKSTHFYLCQEDGCTKIKEEPCTIRVEELFTSCDSSALVYYSCEVCGYSLTTADSSGKPVGHKMETPKHQGTRTEEGQEGEEEREVHYHISKCQNAGCTNSLEEDCTIKTQEVPANCTEYGGTLYTCTACDYSEMDKKIEPLGHQWGAYTFGEKVGEHQRSCTAAGCNVVEKSSCTMNRKIIAATCMEQRKIVDYCVDCGYKTETIDETSSLTGHSYDGTPRSTGLKTHIYSCDYGCGTSHEEACTITTTNIYAPGKKGVKRSVCTKCDYKNDVEDDRLAVMPNQEGAYKVITYNLKSLFYDPVTKLTGIKDQLENVADLLKRFDADVIGLQEVDRNNKRTGYRDQIKELAEAAGYEYYYFCYTYDKTEGEYGTAIISRYPIKGDIERVKYKTQKGEDRYYSRAVIEFPEGDVVFYNTHLCTGSKDELDGAAAKQFTELMDRVCAETLPTLLTGDFNLSHSIREQLLKDVLKYDEEVTSLNAANFNGLMNIDDIYIRNANYYVDPESGRSLFRVEESYSDHKMGYGCFTLE